LGVLEHLLHGAQAATEEVSAQVLEAGTGDAGVHVHAFVQGVDLDGCGGASRELALGTLAGGAEAAHSTRVLGHVLLVLALELLGEVGHQAVVEVLTTEVGVASGGLHLEDAVVDGQEGHVEGAAAQVKDQHGLLAVGFLVQAVRDRGSGGLVDDTHHVESRDGSRIFSGLALGVVEVRRHCDHGVGDGGTAKGLCCLLHLAQNGRADLLGCEGLLLPEVLDLHSWQIVVRGHLEGPVLLVALNYRVTHFATDEPLGVKHGVDRIHRSLVLSGLANEPLRVGERDVRWRGAVALVIGNNLNSVIGVDAYA